MFLCTNHITQVYFPVIEKEILKDCLVGSGKLLHAEKTIDKLINKMGASSVVMYHSEETPYCQIQPILLLDPNINLFMLLAFTYSSQSN